MLREKGNILRFPKNKQTNETRTTTKREIERLLKEHRIGAERLSPTNYLQNLSSCHIIPTCVPLILRTKECVTLERVIHSCKKRGLKDHRINILRLYQEEPILISINYTISGIHPVLRYGNIRLTLCIWCSLYKVPLVLKKIFLYFK